MTTSHQGPPSPTPEELDGYSRDDLARLAAELDDVDVVHNQRKFPVPGTRAEKRAERAVALWFTVSALSGLAFIAAFLFWPFEYEPPTDPIKHGQYLLFTPIAGITFGVSVLALGIACIVYVKKFFPDELSVQQRHDGPSAEVARRTIVAQLTKAGEDSSIGRRSLIKSSGLGALGVFGLGFGIATVAPLVRDPWKGRQDAAMWTTGWKPEHGETVYLRRDTGIADEISLVRPEDQAPGSIETVFPFRNSERGNEEALAEALHRSDNPVMLIRLRPGTPVIQRPGFKPGNFGDFYAYSKICTHLGCPTSLYEAQTQRILCPCHQSQFIATEYAKPVFGPAARPLPQLPITVNDEGYLIATGDFDGAVGPAFWELGADK